MAKKVYRIKTEQKAVIYRTYLIEAESLEDAEREIEWEMELAEGLFEYWEYDEHECPETKSMELIESISQLSEDEKNAMLADTLQKVAERMGK